MLNNFQVCTLKVKKNQIIPFYQIKKPSKHTAVYNYNNELTKNRKKQTEEPVLRKKNIHLAFKYKQ